MTSSLQRRCLLLLCLSVLVLVDHSVEAYKGPRDHKWTEARDDNYYENVAINKQFLTREGRKRHRQLGEANHNSIRGNNEFDRNLVADSSVSELNVLVVLLQWTNHPNRNSAIPRESYDKLFNGEGRDEQLYPGGSVKEWFETMSYGELTINFEVTDWIMTEYTEQRFTTDGSQGRTQELQEAFRPVLDFLDDDFFDFRTFDGNFDRKLDLTVFLHSGYDGAIGATECETGITNKQRIASHARTGADESTWVSKAGYRLGPYAVAPAFREVCDLEIGRIGTIVHEMIHPFGLPDLYDIDGGYTTGNIGGIDRFGVMANEGGNSGGDKAWPGHISAWTRFKLGWAKPTVIDSDGVYELRPVEKHPDLYQITKGFEDKEYLLLENRQPIDGDFDEKFMDPGGVVIYHIDENIFDTFNPSGNSARGGPFQDGWPGNGKHYPVAILQADGLYELEQGINGGNSDDIWNKPSHVLGPGNGEKVASSANYPNTDSYAFGVIKPTGITIKNFVTKRSTMAFQVCGLSSDDCPENEIPNDSSTDGPEPTDSPTDGQAPTATPTVAPTLLPIEELENGSCDIAVDSFRPGDSSKGISNITKGTRGNTCYGGEGIGVWYKIDAGTLPDSENTVRATTCFSETQVVSKISVFKGGNCSALECVETKQMECKNGHLGHIVYWEVEEDEDYHLFVHSVEESDEISDVEILGDGSLHLDVFNFAPMKNDNCLTSTNMPTTGKRVGGSTERATPALNVTSSDTCDVESAGVWFKVMGTGSEFKATTCHPGTSSPTQIHVFSGSCDSLSCVTVEANNYAVCSDFDIATNSATVNFITEEGLEYFILVGSRDGNGGVFELSVSETTPESNDQCPNANALAMPGDTIKVSGSTVNATNDFPYGEYCGTILDTAGVWYTIEGTGQGLSVSTCGQNDYNSAISIFTGSDCGELECLTGISTRDPACDFEGVTAAWLSEEGETYHVYVHGSAQNSYGTFELEAEKFDVLVENEFCSEALAITDAGVYVKGSTIDAAYSAPTNVCGAEAVKPGLWYTFEGTGAPFYFSGCPLDNIDVSVSFFSGDTCGELECLDGATYTVEDCGSLEELMSTGPNRFLLGSGNPANYTSLDSINGTTYYMVIHGQARPDPETGEITDGVGNFDFTFFSGVAPPPPTNVPNNQGGDNGDEGNDNDEEEEEEDNDEGGDVVPEIDSEEKESNKLSRRKLVYILLGVGALLTIAFCTPPCWIYREKIFGRCQKSNPDEDEEGLWDPSNPPNALDMEEAPFHDERPNRKSKTPISPRRSSSEGGKDHTKQHKWQTLSIRAS